MLIHTESFTVRGNETGPDLKLSLPALASYIQEAAWTHSIPLGVSIYDLQKKEMTWVLSRLSIEMDRRLSHHESLKIVTWPAGVNRHYVFRDYLFEDESGKRIGKAKTVWAIIDLKSRKPIQPPSFVTEMPIQKEIPLLPVNTEWIPKADHYPYRKRFTAGWHDIDINRHVNNLSYTRWAIESTPLEVLKTRDIRGFDIIFKAESNYGDQIESLTQNEDGSWGSALHQLKCENTGKELVLARSVWR